MSIKNLGDLFDYIGQDTCYLYGNGLYGKFLFSFLKENGVRVGGFFVSDISCISNELVDYTRQIDRYQGEKIIVAVSSQYRDQIVSELDNRKIQKYCCIPEDVFQQIESKTLYREALMRKNKGVNVLYYHRVLNENKDFWQLNTHIDTFESHMKMLQNQFQVLPVQGNLFSCSEGGVCVTFDDGYCDNYYHALPIIEKYEIPTMIFVSTDLLGKDLPMWWDELEEMIIWNSSLKEFEYEDRFFSCKDLEERKRVCREMREMLRFLLPTKRECVMEKLRKATGVGEIDYSSRRILRLDELKKLAESPFISIGCHTKSHISIGKQEECEILDEIVTSKEILENIVDKPIEVFSYPYGGYEDFSACSKACLEKAGIKRAFTTLSGLVEEETDCLEMPRNFVGNISAMELERQIRRRWCI